LPQSPDTVRTGKKYFFRNYGEELHFVVLEIIHDTEFKVKDLLTLETYYFSDLIKYGRGNDYELIEMHH